MPRSSPAIRTSAAARPPCSARGSDHARFFSLCAEHRGSNVEAFTSYEEAMEWLLV
jgi:hypothetical protein